MPFQSPFPALDIPQCNVLSYLFPPDRKLGDKPVWINAAAPTESLSADQSLALIRRLAVGLDNNGISEGKVVMVLTPNHIYVSVAYLAVAGSKRCFSGVNPAFTAEEVAYQMKVTDVALVLVHPTSLETGMAAARRAGIPHDKLFLFSDKQERDIKGVKDWRHLLATEADSAHWQWDPLSGMASKKTTAVINFSSGTTGLPKGVCITHHNLVANTAQTIWSRFHHPTSPSASGDSERWVSFLPLYHAYSQLWTINLALKQGISVYIMEKFQFEDLLRNIQTYKITALSVVPPVMVMLAKRRDIADYDISSVRHVVCGAAPLAPDLQADLCQRFNFIVAQGWGMTETTCVGTLVPGHEVSMGTVGKLVPNTEAKLVDEGGREVESEGQEGEILIRGPQVMLKYWNNESATSESLSGDGWYRTGDVAVVKNNDFIIVDRRKELIKVNGLQVAPAELEAVLLKLDEVADAAVVGISVHGEELPRAYVVLQPEWEGKIKESEIQAKIASRVAKHKRLGGGVKYVKEIPKLASGKILRKVVKEWAKKDAVNEERRTKPRL
ncbi:Phenylacetyl-CoA ligase epaB [Paramyrothecium foliicola]|nr:Phenylacetyl-CoA ligase epaB [Paramyrothecium foliicola]